MNSEATISQQAAKQVEYSLERPTLLTHRLDYYKPTMAQLAFEHFPGAQVSFEFKNRGKQQLGSFIESAELSNRLETIAAQGWQERELRYLGSLQISGGFVFSDRFLDYLADMKLPEVEVKNAGFELQIKTTGDWPAVTFWETAVLSQVNELYFENLMASRGLNPSDVYEEGDRRLSRKIEILRANPDIKFADFGTRRHFSPKWQSHVLSRLAQECPGNLIGTSNVGLAYELGLKPIGTYAHEMPMVYGGLADSQNHDLRISHHEFMDDWFDKYGTDYSIALTDTFGSDFFFGDFSRRQASQWRGVRHDSGDPYVFAEKVIEFYRSYGIDPKSKTIVFSDGLDIDQIVKLHQIFESQINTLFGWGTTLTNDLGIKALNIVMKAVAVNGFSTVKLSDDAGKHTGPQQQLERYKMAFAA